MGGEKDKMNNGTFRKHSKICNEIWLFKKIIFSPQILFLYYEVTMVDKKLLEGINNKIKALSELKTSEYVRIETLGEKYGFKEAEDLFHQIKNLFGQLIDYDLSVIPAQRLDSINDHIDRIMNAFKNIKEFDPDQPKNGDKPTLIKNLDESYSNFFVLITPIIGYLSSSFGFMKMLKSDADSALKDINGRRKEIEKQKKEFDNQTEQIIKSLKDSAAESGVTRHSKIFADEADDHKTLAFRWFLGMLFFICFACFVVYLIWDLVPKMDNPNLYQVIQYTLLKIIVFSVLYYLLLFIIRNYNAHRHNYIVNKHRQNALSSFETFVNSTTNPEIKDAVLLQTTQSIFSAQVSGYLKNEGDESNPNKFIEIIRNAGSIANSK